MRDCLTASAEHKPLPPNKRVNYAFGMVLGVDDFRQEQEHFEWKSRISNLRLHGYGTVCGLRLTAYPVANNTEVEIRISAGYAISPQGKWIWVERDLCARLTEWLDRQPDQPVSPPIAGPRTVYVKLCYDECPTDAVPIAGNPCASDEDLQSPSRILETARAEFSWEPLAQPAEDHFRQFGDLLSRVQISNVTLSPDDSQLLIELVRDLGVESSPPAITSPPPPTIQLSAATAVETIRQALTVWVTEVCPRLGHSDEDCILIAGLRFDVDDDGRLIFTVDGAGNLTPDSLEIDESARPILAPDRLKQELFCLIGREGASSLPFFFAAPRALRLEESAEGGEARAPAFGFDLTRICGISWNHAAGTPISRLQIPGVAAPSALAIAFDGGVRANDLNEHTVQVRMALKPRASGPVSVAGEGLLQGAVLPAHLDLVALPEGASLIRRADPIEIEAGPPGEGELVNGVVFALDQEPGELSDLHLTVLVKGDFIQDANHQSLDANHLAPWLPNAPTGDQAPGGLFESWLTLAGQSDEPADANNADLLTLVTAGVPTAVAERIIALREDGPFTSKTNLRTRLGMTATEFKPIEPNLTFG